MAGNLLPTIKSQRNHGPFNLACAINAYLNAVFPPLKREGIKDKKRKTAEKRSWANSHDKMRQNVQARWEARPEMQEVHPDERKMQLSVYNSE